MICSSDFESVKLVKKTRASSTLSDASSPIFFPDIFTLRKDFLSLCQLQDRHICSVAKVAILLKYVSLALSASECLRSRLGISPSYLDL